MLSARVPHVCIAFYIVCEKYHFFCPDLDEGPAGAETTITIHDEATACS